MLVKCLDKICNFLTLRRQIACRFKEDITLAGAKKRNIFSSHNRTRVSETKESEMVDSMKKYDSYFQAAM